jgi:hypothetical protein
MKVMDTTRARLLVVLALLGGLLALSPFAPAKANPSAWCSDPGPGNPHVQLVSGDFGLPLWLGVESGADTGSPGLVNLCYGTGAPDDSKTLGGTLGVEVKPRSGGVDVHAHNAPDDNSALSNSVTVFSWPTYSVSPGGTGGGQALTFTIPVAVCSGPCLPTTQPADGQSGVIVGTISQAPAGGTSAAYRVDNLCVQVDGATVLGRCDGQILDDAGVTTTGTAPVSAVPGTPGPCVVGACAPSFDSIGTTGRQLATLYVPGLGTVPVYGVHTCLYQENASTPCPS